MTRRFSAVLAALCLSAPSLAQPDARPGDPVVRFDGSRIVRINLRSAADLLTMQGIGAEVWACEPRIGPCDFRIPPASMAALDASGIRYAVIVPDLQKRVDAENARLRAQAGGGVQDAGWFDDFKDWQAVSDYIDTLAALRPDLAKRISFGKSLEGRDLFGLRIANDSFDTGHCKPVILLNATQHAREWIATMVGAYDADQLLRQYGIDPAITAAVDHAEIDVIPVTNPDGYVYTWTTDRFWRKNRRNNGDGTFGVDNNRNWGYQWGLTLPGGNGGNANTGSDVYWGTAPFSEPENQALRDWALAHPGLRGQNDIHSYGQLILQPWGYTDAPPPDDAFFDALGQALHDIIKSVHGQGYTNGSLYSTLYPVSGSAEDWFFADRGAVSLTYELRGPGFDPPANQILPCAQEVFAATIHHIQTVIDRYPFRADWNADCVYDLFDFLAFVNDFNAGNPKADFDGDGVLDLFDFLGFVNAFNAGQ